jgi:alpha-tubulin suppressor-like RCC1 family protein
MSRFHPLYASAVALSLGCNSTGPSDIIVPPPAYSTVAVGSFHVCALAKSGGAYCWGRNSYGQVGDATVVGDTSLPVPVTGGQHFISIAASFQRLLSLLPLTCGLAQGGQAFCWGGDALHQLGPPDPTLCPGFPGSSFETPGPCRQAPTPVAASRFFLQIAAGGATICGVTLAYRLFCWGNGADGQLATGATTSSSTPITVLADQDVGQVSVGDTHICALLRSGIALCWGANGSGQLGDGTRTARLWPIRVQTAHRFVKLSAGGDHSCGLADDQSAWCWGDDSDLQLGVSVQPSGDPGIRTTPTPVEGGHHFQTISAGLSHTCAIDTAGVAFCWGHNIGGVLGISATPWALTPLAVDGGHQFSEISASSFVTCGLDIGRVVYCWGNGYSGLVGNGQRALVLSPTPVTFP